MDFSFTEDQQRIRDTVLEYCSQFSDEYWLERDHEGVFPHDFHKSMADSGWLGVAMPEAVGGAGLGITEAASWRKRCSTCPSPTEKTLNRGIREAMTGTGEIFSARSWLFAPGDSERKMGKAAAGTADIVVFDLEDAVTEGGKPKSRAMISALLAAQAEEDRSRLWVRVNPLDGPHTVADLAAVIPARPGGIMLPKSRGRQDVEELDHYLSALEVSAGIKQGSTKVIVLVGETAESMFTTGTYQGAPRLVAMTWGAEDLADAVGASQNRNPDGSYGFTYELARSLCLLGAAAAGVAPVDTIHGDFRDLEGLRARAEKVRRDGYRGMLAIHPDQVDVINAAFTPTAEELAAAQEIVDLFAANPGVGAIGYQGAMLDRPHLARAQALLASGGRT